VIYVKYDADLLMGHARIVLGKFSDFICKFRGHRSARRRGPWPCRRPPLEFIGKFYEFNRFLGAIVLNALRNLAYLIRYLGYLHDFSKAPAANLGRLLRVPNIECY
jgi:hypothetical protein